MQALNHLRKSLRKKKPVFTGVFDRIFFRIFCKLAAVACSVCVRFGWCYCFGRWESSRQNWEDTMEAKQKLGSKLKGALLAMSRAHDRAAATAGNVRKIILRMISAGWSRKEIDSVGAEAVKAGGNSATIVSVISRACGAVAGLRARATVRADKGKPRHISEEVRELATFALEHYGEKAASLLFQAARAVEKGWVSAAARLKAAA